MIVLLALFAICLPVVLAGAQFLPGRMGSLARELAAWAALPVLLLSLLPIPVGSADLEWFLLGARLELDTVGRLFLVLFAVLWTAAGVFARHYLDQEEQRRFFAFFLLAMAGNLGLPLAADAASFYLLFALMTFSGYGLVVHRGDPLARRAGRVYLILAVLGEAFLLAGLILDAMSTGSLGVGGGAITGGGSGLTVAFLLVGFGIKAGAVPLHVWLPLAHPVAPTPASAVLSGAMIKAGILGWIRFLPLGDPAVTGWGGVILLLGVVAAFFGVVIGLFQTDPKTVLAYSSISQMGVMNIGLGVGMAVPEAAAAAVAVVTVYALHHGLAKGALFLGVGMSGAGGGATARRLIHAGLLLPALAIAGAPVTSGAIAKGGLKNLLSFAPATWGTWVAWVLPLSALATTLLMARFIHLVLTGEKQTRDSPVPAGMWLPWSALLLVVGGGVVALVALRLPGENPAYFGGIGLADIAPLLIGVAVFGVYWRLAPRADTVADPAIAPGDLLNPVSRWFSARPRPAPGPERPDPVLTFTSRWYYLYADSQPDDLALRLEMRLTRWAPAILTLLLVLALFFVMLWRSP